MPLARTPLTGADAKKRTRSQVEGNPTMEETRSKALELRRKKWLEEDAAEESRLRTVGLTVDDSLLNTVNVSNDLKKEDVARLFVKILATFDFEKYFPVDDTTSILAYLLVEYEAHSIKQLDPAVAGVLLENAPLSDLKTNLDSRRANVCSRLNILSNGQSDLQVGVIEWSELEIHYRTAAIMIWREMLDTCLVLRYLHGTSLTDELKRREIFVKTEIVPVMEMFLTEVRDKQYKRPVLFSNYDLETPVRSRQESQVEELLDLEEEELPKGMKTPQGRGRETASPDEEVTIRRRPIFNAPTDEELYKLRKKAAALSEERKFRLVTPQRTRSDRSAIPVASTMTMESRADDIKTILQLSGVDSDKKLKWIAELTKQDTQPVADDLDELADKFNFKLDEPSAAAYGDEKALAQYNTLPNVQLPPFYGNSLEFSKWWQMFIYLVDKNPKIPQIMKLHILQKSLKGNAEYLTHQITFSPHSYETLKDNVREAFDDADAALRQLTDRLRAWPILKRNDYTQLAEFTGFATNYVMQLMHFENGAAFNPRNVVYDLYGKFNPQMMGDYRREWAAEEHLKGKQSDRQQVVWLLDWLKERLKVARAYYHADPNRQQIPLGMPSGIAMEFKSQTTKNVRGKVTSGNQAGNAAGTKKPASVSTAENLYIATMEDPAYYTADVFATASNRGRGRGFRGNPRGRGRGAPGAASARGRGRGRGNFNATPSMPAQSTGGVRSPPTNTYATPSSNIKTESGDKKDTGYDLLPCLFCGQHQHSARTCNQHMKPDTVYLKAVEAYLCLNCLRFGHYASACPHPGCGMEGCNMKHNKRMHGHRPLPPRNQ